MSDGSNDVFEVTHEARLIDFQGKPLCCIIDENVEHKTVCDGFRSSGYDYNLKGVILRNSKGHNLACRYTLRDAGQYLDYRIAPSNEWVSKLRESKRLAIVDAVGIVMLIGDDIWTGDIELVLQRFYSTDDDDDDE